MIRSPRRVIFVFIDGIGIGTADARRNPFAAARLPVLRALLGGRLPLLDELDADGGIEATGATLVAADARLGVPGRPQSGTGQTALLTGENAPALYGRHFGSWVPTGLRELLATRSLLRVVQEAGGRAIFANAHPPHIPVDRRPSAPALAAHAAGLLTRGAVQLRELRAVASSITNERWLAHPGLGDGVPRVTPEEAGRVLCSLAGEAELTLFAHYDTDFVGHRGSLAEAVAVIERVDAFLGGVLGALPPDTMLLVASDHGNLEDVRQGHTLNPVPVIATGAGHDRLRGRVASIIDVAGIVREALGIAA